MYACYVAIITSYGEEKDGLKTLSKGSNSKTEKGRAIIL